MYAQAKTSAGLPLAGGDLDSLAAMRSKALGKLYRQGRCPEHLADLDGDPTGRMLVVRGMDLWPLAPRVRRLASAAAFPWGGKSFAASEVGVGRGINRVKLGGRHLLFPFETHLGASAVDGEPAFILDYDLEDNPAFIRAIHDEVREVAPGLFLGPAMWKTDNDPALVLWFGLDTRLQAPAIHW